MNKCLVIDKNYHGLKDVGYAYEYDGDINHEGSIEIKLDKLLKVSKGIRAGCEIKAGSGIESGLGIESGSGINCKRSITFRHAIFAGICYWRESSDEDKTITCGKFNPIDGAKLEYGILNEIGLPEEKEEFIEIRINKAKAIKLGLI